MATGVLWSMTATVVCQALSLVASLVTARLLGKLGLGEFGMVISTAGTFGLLAGLGLGLTATKYLAELRLTDPKRAGRILSLAYQTAFVSGSLVGLVFFLFAPVKPPPFQA